MLAMERSRPPRKRAAMKSALVVLAVMLICQAVLPGVRIHGARRLRAQEEGAQQDGERRLAAPGWTHKLFGGGKKPQEDVAGEARKKTNLTPRAHAAGSSPEILETVDFSAEDGFLWQPMSMSQAECLPGQLECDTTIRYCLINIGEYQENPWKYPMAVMLQKRSQCGTKEKLRAYRLSTLRTYVREHPDEFLPPSGFVYHETRTGSTLVANMLGHVPTNLVLSENSISEDPARRCTSCTDEQRIGLLRDILPLMGSTKAGHTHTFFKFQDSTTLDLMAKAFPDVSWVYLFRDPVEVMVSNLKGAYGKRNRFYEADFDYEAADNSTVTAGMKPGHKSARPMLSPCLMASSIKMKGMAKEAICATRLKTLCEAAIAGLDSQAEKGGVGRGAVVEYTNLPEAVTEFIYPDMFGMGPELLKEHLPYLLEAARMYSKSMSNPESEFTLGTDAAYKHVMAEKAYKDAAESTGLTAVYETLQGLQTWHKDK